MEAGRFSKMVGWSGIIASLMATNAYAFIAPTNAPAGVKVKSHVLRPSVYTSGISAFDADGADVKLDGQSNSIRQMSGNDLLGVVVNNISSQSIEKAAKDLIASRPDIFGVSINDVRLVANGTHIDNVDQIVNFQVLRAGLRIQDAGITLRFKSGHLSSLKAETFAEAVIAPASVSNTGDIAAKALNSQGYISRGSKWRVQPTNAGYSLVKVDEYVVAGADAAWIVQVNTTNGDLFEVRSKNLNLRGRAVATVYPRYFGETITEAGLPFSKVSNASARSNEQGEFQSTNGSDAPAMEGFSGQFAIVHNEAGADLSAKATKTGNMWNLKFDIAPAATLWDNNKMAQAMVYVNVNRVITQAKKFVSPEWFNKPLQANVNHSEHCNAYWDGDSINFFSAGSVKTRVDGANTEMVCANTGLISDVVFHEWGHGLDDNTGGIDDGALSEGFGDAVALLFTDDSKVGIDFRPVDHKPVRDMSVVKKFPDDVVDEVHADGLIIGGAWYDMYTALKQELGVQAAKDLYSKFLFKGIYAAAKMSDVYEATLTLDDDDSDRSNGTPHLCIINKAFTRHGLATADSHCD